MSDKYRIVPTIIGNRLKAWKLQHKFWFIWKDTVFENGKVIVTNREEIQEVINHLNETK